MDERLNQVATLNSVSLQYDGFGRRTKNLQNTSFLFDGANSVQELSGSTATANLISGGIDEIFTRADSAGAFTPLRDALGSTIALVDSSGNVVTTYAYDPFGGTIVSGSANANEYQYTGRENEGNGLYFLRARYYSPVLGRFISEDPVGFNGGSTNVYAYVRDNPANLSDPTGENPACLVGGLLGTIAYNSNVIYQSIAGRKANYYAGLSGLGHIAKGNTLAFGAGCATGTLLAPLAFSVPTGAGVVYGGGAGSALAAANAAEGTIIADTVGGQIASYLTAGGTSLSEGLNAWIWDYASAQFASGLSGTVTVFQGSFGVAGQYAAASDLVTVELPILYNAAQNGLVNLIWVFVP